jgi:hypothetical protein
VNAQQETEASKVVRKAALKLEPRFRGDPRVI